MSLQFVTSMFALKWLTKNRVVFGISVRLGRLVVPNFGLVRCSKTERNGLVQLQLADTLPTARVVAVQRCAWVCRGCLCSGRSCCAPLRGFESRVKNRYLWNPYMHEQPNKDSSHSKYRRALMPLPGGVPMHSGCGIVHLMGAWCLVPSKPG